MPITLEQLIALNDEMLALVRAGVPLERSLAGLGRDLRGRLGRLSDDLSGDLTRGRSLSEALAARSADFPPTYRAIVTAGVRSAKLSVALEGLATSARRIVELRRAAMLAMLYPLVVLLFAYGLMLVILFLLPPVLRSIYEAATPGFVVAMERAGQTVAWWGPVFPLVVVVAGAVWLIETRRAWTIQDSRASRLLGWLPGFKRLARDARAATLAEVTGLLVEQGVALPEALVLSGEATGAPRLADACRRWAEALREGQLAAHLARHTRDLPGVFTWALTTGPGGSLPELLRHAAEHYRNRALRQADWLRVTLPVLFTTLVGGTATIVYALVVFVPFTQLLKYLAGLGP
jgi:general secretion pathway protein F